MSNFIRSSFPRLFSTFSHRCRPSSNPATEYLVAATCATSALCSFTLLHESPSTKVQFEAAYKIDQYLGRGTYGTVASWHAKNEENNRVAVKSILKSKVDKSVVVSVQQERNILELIAKYGGHENVVGYEQFLADDTAFYIVMEYVQGETLLDHMQKSRRLNEDDARDLLKQLISGTHFLHCNDILHMDIKPENILLTSSEDKLHLKIVDFGCAIEKRELAHENRISWSGTQSYWSPEMLQGGQCSEANDMFAIGCIAYILLTGRHPFDYSGCSSQVQIMDRIVHQPLRFDTGVWKTISKDMISIVKGLLEKNPEQRLTAAQVDQLLK